jgi:glycosyltransferase involved in cell wall biosynthesis
MRSHQYQLSLSVVIPVYNDEEVLPELHRRLHSALNRLCPAYELIFVDDGSRDRSLHVLTELQADHDSIKVIQLTRNFGQPNAIAAGLEYAEGDVIVLMDSDLQDRPEDIQKLLDAMIEHNVPMAIARWATRKDNLIKVAASKLFNAIANKITNVHYISRSRVFRVMKREIIKEVKQFPEKTATSVSLLYWMGCGFVTVDLDRDPRYAGSSGYTWGKMLKLSLDRIFSYSLFPIRLSSILGVILGISSVLLAIYFVVQKLFLMRVVPGWTSIVVILLFLLGMNFIFLGIIGEYLGRIYIETKNRPKYVIKKVYHRTEEEKE